MRNLGSKGPETRGPTQPDTRMNVENKRPPGVKAGEVAPKTGAAEEVR